MKMIQALLDLAKQLVLGDSGVGRSEDSRVEEETFAVDGEMSGELDQGWAEIQAMSRDST